MMSKTCQRCLLVLFGWSFLFTTSFAQIAICENVACLSDRGVTLLYDSEEGNFSVETGVKDDGREQLLTTIHVQSKDIDIFTGIPNQDCSSGLFENFLPRKFFRLDPVGMGGMDCGPVMEKGLDAATLAETLTVEGSILGGGQLPDPITLAVNPRNLFSPYDYNTDGRIDHRDLNLLRQGHRWNRKTPEFDVNGDGEWNTSDIDFMVTDLIGTWIGDANWDDLFDSRDFVHVFEKGEYEDDRIRNSNWEDGDWNHDLEFDSNDLVAAFQDGGYGTGFRNVVSVPEPIFGSTFFAVAVILAVSSRTRSSR